MEYFEKIKEILVKQLGKDPSEITPETSFEALGIDSLDAVEMIMSMEEEFEIEVSDEEAEAFDSIASVLDFLTKKLA